MDTSSSDAYSEEQMEGFFINACLIESFARRIAQKLWYAREVLRWGDTSTISTQVARHVEVIYQAWWLADNMRGLYEILAGRLNVSREEIRLAVQDRIAGRNRPKVRFHKAVWLYNRLGQIPSEAIVKVGLNEDEARQTLDELVTRSCRLLQAAYEKIADFHEKYRELAAAYEHGRGVFPVTVLVTGPGLAPSVSVRHDEKCMTAFRSNPDGSTTLVEFTPDDEYRLDLKELFRVIHAQLPLLRKLLHSLVDFTTAELKRLRGGTVESSATWSMTLFAAPYSDRELEILRKLRGVI